MQIENREYFLKWSKIPTKKLEPIEGFAMFPFKDTFDTKLVIFGGFHLHSKEYNKQIYSFNFGLFVTLLRLKKICSLFALIKERGEFQVEKQEGDIDDGGRAFFASLKIEEKEGEELKFFHHTSSFLFLSLKLAFF